MEGSILKSDSDLGDFVHENKKKYDVTNVTKGNVRTVRVLSYHL